MTEPIDVLMLQLGTPKAPTAAGLRPYLREFLSDPRVLEIPWLVRWLLVNGIIVPFRSPKSAAKYRLIWDDETGSPLLSITKRQSEGVAARLGEGFRVRFAMRYGSPNIREVVPELCRGKSPRRMIVLPMFPQYSATTTASGFDALFDALKRERIVPEVRLIPDYHLDPGYLDALAEGIREEEAKAEAAGQAPEVRMLSFHGIPISYIKRGDPYMRLCAETGKQLAKRLGWTRLADETTLPGSWRLCFQSRLGSQKWLMPYTDETLVSLAERGIKRVLVAQPGFTADCLETIDEIGREGDEEFREAGGESLWRVPCLNDRPSFLDALAAIVRRHADAPAEPAHQPATGEIAEPVAEGAR